MSLFDVRRWAFFVLQRLADLIGRDHLQASLKKERNAYSFFSGVECVRHAWAFIHAAALELWGITTGLRFEGSVTDSVEVSNITRL